MLAFNLAFDMLAFNLAFDMLAFSMAFNIDRGKFVFTRSAYNRDMLVLFILSSVDQLKILAFKILAFTLAFNIFLHTLKRGYRVWT